MNLTKSVTQKFQSAFLTTIFFAIGLAGWMNYPVHPDEVNLYLFLKKWSLYNEAIHYFPQCYENMIVKSDQLLKFFVIQVHYFLEIIHDHKIRMPLGVLFCAILILIWRSNSFFLPISIALIFLTPASLIFYLARPEFFILLFVIILMRVETSGAKILSFLAFPVMCSIHPKAIFFAPLLFVVSFSSIKLTLVSLLSILLSLMMATKSAAYHSKCNMVPELEMMLASFFINPLEIFTNAGKYFRGLVLPDGYWERYFQQLTFGIPSDLGHLPLFPVNFWWFDLIPKLIMATSMCVISYAFFKFARQTSFLRTITEVKKELVLVFVIIFLLFHDRTLNFYNVYFYHTLICLCFASSMERLWDDKNKVH